MSHMDFSLSPLSDVELREARNELRRAEDVLRDCCKVVSKHYRKTGEKLDYLALVHPAVKKTNQKHEQRQRASSDNVRNWRKICVKRAGVWQQLYAEPFIKNGKEFLRREVRADGKEYIGTKGAIVGRKAEKPKSRKDHPGLKLTGERGDPSKMFRHNPLFEEVMLKVTNSFDKDVPEPTPVGGMFEHHAVHRRKK